MEKYKSGEEPQVGDIVTLGDTYLLPYAVRVVRISVDGSLYFIRSMDDKKFNGTDHFDDRRGKEDYYDVSCFSLVRRKRSGFMRLLLGE